jgi:TolB protein
MKKIIFVLPIFLTLIFSSNLKAQISFSINQATSKKIPIAVKPILNEKNKENKLTKEISNLIQRDLNIAGYFEVLDPDTFLEITPEINFEQWTFINAHGLITGVITSKSKKISLELKFYDTHAKKLMVGKQYSTDKDLLYKVIHKFLDDVILSITGTKGPFNTDIVASCGVGPKKQIKTFRIDGTGEVQVTNNGVNNISPTFSPDGENIVFTSFVSYYPEIYTINRKNNNKFKALTNNQSTNITPSFSQQGYHIAYSSSQNGDAELYLMDTKGKTIKRLTKTYSIDISPTWNPNGREIVFASERMGGLHLFKMDIFSGATTRLTYTGYQNDQPDFSPNGEDIVFTSRDQGAFDIFTMKADGTKLQRITKGEGSNESPSFSPDGNYITFSSKRRGREGLYVMRKDGSNQLPIPGTTNCINPEWGPRDN